MTRAFYQFELSMVIARHVAKVLKLPGLFLGAWHDTTIEYIHLSHTTNAPGFQRQCVVLKCNDDLYGMFIFVSSRVSSIVKLPDANPVFTLLKKHRTFMGDETVQFNNYNLNATLMFSGGMIRHYIRNPHMAEPHVVALRDAHFAIFTQIESQIEQNQQVLSPPANFKGQLPVEAGSFLRRYHRLRYVGQSGLFGQADAPHDTEYILDLRVYGRENSNDYCFVKTRHFFRGLIDCCWEHKRSDTNKKQILDLKAPEVDWYSLMDAAQNYVFRGHMIALEISMNISTVDNDRHLLLELSDDKRDAPEIWHVLKTLIAQFPEG